MLEDLLAKPLAVASFAACFFGFLLLQNYFRSYSQYLHGSNESSKGDLPPRYPTLIPYLGVIFPLLWDITAFLERMTSFAGQPSSMRIGIAPTFEVFFFQGQETIKEIWKKSTYMCAGKVHVWASRYLFGMPEAFLDKYASDNSGPFIKPYPNSNVSPHLRIHRIMNEGNEKALTGPGFEPTMRRVKEALAARIEQLEVPAHEATQIHDFYRLIREVVAGAIIESIFGPNFLQINPGFIDDLGAFDQAMPWLARGTPRLLKPSIYQLRSRLHGQMKRWYEHARANFTETSIDRDGDGDPYWGSRWMRERQEILQTIGNDDALAAGDLGVAWASTSNIVSATVLALIHIAGTPSLCEEVRDEITTVRGGRLLKDVEVKELSGRPLLASIYAETLRLHAKSFTVLSSPVKDTVLGDSRLPRNRIGLVNAHIAHMDDNFWNTQVGLHPLQSFWSRRFVTNPSDPTSGPSVNYRQPNSENKMDPYFSLKGLEGAWIPYGDFDLEVLDKNLTFNKSWFGFGTEIPKHSISVTLRRKSPSTVVHKYPLI